jgi:hypothetical protein
MDKQVISFNSKIQEEPWQRPDFAMAVSLVNKVLRKKAVNGISQSAASQSVQRVEEIIYQIKFKLG